VTRTLAREVVVEPDHRPGHDPGEGCPHDSHGRRARVHEVL